MAIKNNIDDLKRLGYSMKIMNEIPVTILLQHCLDAFITLAPIAVLAFLTLLLTINKK